MSKKYLKKSLDIMEKKILLTLLFILIIFPFIKLLLKQFNILKFIMVNIFLTNTYNLILYHNIFIISFTKFWTISYQLQ